MRNLSTRMMTLLSLTEYHRISLRTTKEDSLQVDADEVCYGVGAGSHLSYAYQTLVTF